jgi:hypothetical protein
MKSVFGISQFKLSFRFILLLKQPTEIVDLRFALSFILHLSTLYYNKTLGIGSIAIFEKPLTS